MVLATQCVAPGKVEFVELPPPSPKPGQAVVRTLLMSLCGSDVQYAYYADERKYPFPVATTGHEIIGVVEEVDAPASDLKPGDLVLALAPHHEGATELYCTSAENVLPLPTGKPLEHLLMAQQLGTVIYSCKRLPNIVDKDVAVIGQGSAGLFWNAMCRRLGARRVIGMDLVDARVAAATRFGATHALNNARTDPVAAVQEILGGKLADLVIEAAGNEEAILLAPQLARQEGHLFYFGIPRRERFEFDFEAFFRKFLHTQSMTGAMLEPGRRSFRLALELIASGEIDASPLPTHRFPFARIREALELARTCADGALKIIIEMPAYQKAK